MRSDFAIFILTHGRPDNVSTINTLKRIGYTGKIYLILDNEDETAQKYIDNYGAEKCIIFDKEKASLKFDVMDNFGGRKVVVFARNVCNEIARELGIKYFAEFEDDYLQIRYRYPEGDKLKLKGIKKFDDVCNIMIEFVDAVSKVQPKFRSIAFAQGGDMFGGVLGSVWRGRIKRKAMNSFFFKVPENPEEDIMFIGRMNDDVNTYTTDGCVGGVWLQIADIMLTQELTQQKSGGNTEQYKKYGTYVKSFYSVMCQPSCVKISTMGMKNKRIHHNVDFNRCVPKILNEKWRK